MGNLSEPLNMYALLMGNQRETGHLSVAPIRISQRSVSNIYNLDYTILIFFRLSGIDTNKPV